MHNTTTFLFLRLLNKWLWHADLLPSIKTPLLNGVDRTPINLHSNVNPVRTGINIKRPSVQCFLWVEGHITIIRPNRVRYISLLDANNRQQDKQQVINARTRITLSIASTRPECEHMPSIANFTTLILSSPHSEAENFCVPAYHRRTDDTTLFPHVRRFLVHPRHNRWMIWMTCWKCFNDFIFLEWINKSRWNSREIWPNEN